MTRSPHGGLIPIDLADAEDLARIKSGEVLRVQVRRTRNPRFFRKWWALAKVAFDIWSDTMPAKQYKGVDVRPNFDRFRKDLTILAGYYEPVFNARGELRLEAASLGFGSMSEAEFEQLYSSTIDAILSKVLGSSRLTREQLDAHVERVMHFS